MVLMEQLVEMVAMELLVLREIMEGEETLGLVAPEALAVLVVLVWYLVELVELVELVVLVVLLILTMVQLLVVTVAV